MRHMVRPLYIGGLPPNLFHQSRRIVNVRPSARPSNDVALRESVAGSFGAQDPPGGPRDLALSAYLQFSFSRMRRVDLFEATMQGWARLNPSQRERFFKAGLKAALRLKPLEFRAWL